MFARVNSPLLIIAVPPPPSRQEDLWSWLLDSDCDDQYVLRHDNLTTVCWNKREESVRIESRSGWTETHARFSPKGAYLTTIHRQGIALWGGKSWKRLVFCVCVFFYLSDLSFARWLLLTDEISSSPMQPCAL